MKDMKIFIIAMIVAVGLLLFGLQSVDAATVLLDENFDGYTNLAEMLELTGLDNPFRVDGLAIVSDQPTQQGEVGYSHAGYNSDPYTISGYGHQGLLLDVNGNVFLLTPH